MLDVIAGRSASGLCGWLDARGEAWHDGICWAVLDLSGPLKLYIASLILRGVTHDANDTTTKRAGRALTERNHRPTSRWSRSERPTRCSTSVRECCDVDLGTLPRVPDAHMPVASV